MNRRLVALAVTGGVFFTTLSSAFSMNVERIVTIQTQSIRNEAAENLRKRKEAEADAHAYVVRQPHARRHSVRPSAQAGPGRHNE